jgi:hypothetical protein
MKSFSLIFVLFGLLFAIAPLVNVVRADSDTSSETTTTIGRGRRGGGKNSNNSQPTSNPGSIKGTCTVVESPSNPIAGPCVTTMLILNDIDGNEVARDRTTAQGQFEFTADPGKAYKIAPGSKFYDLVAPKTAVHGGDKVNLQLQQK